MAVTYSFFLAADAWARDGCGGWPTPFFLWYTRGKTGRATLRLWEPCPQSDPP